MMITRRSVVVGLSGSLIGWPLRVRAQPTAIVGFLGATWPEPYRPLVAEFYRGLRDVGRAEGDDVAVDERWARGDYGALPALAAALVSRRPAVIVTSGGDVTALAAKALSSTIPIIFADGADPVAFGLVTSLARPGANATGMVVSTLDLALARFKLLSEIVPSAGVVAVLLNPENPIPAVAERGLRAAAQASGTLLVVIEASSEDDFDKAFARIARYRAAGLIVAADALFNSRAERLVALAAHAAVPALYPWRTFVASGGLMSYGPSLAEAYHQAGIYAGRIVAGALPADLPVVQPAKPELVVNIKTAAALGLKIPPSLLARAAAVIA